MIKVIDWLGKIPEREGERGEVLFFAQLYTLELLLYAFIHFLLSNNAKASVIAADTRVVRSRLSDYSDIKRIAPI